MAAPGNLADQASGPKIECLTDSEDGLADVAALRGRLDLPTIDPTPEGYSTSMPGRMSFKFLVSPLGVDRVDADFHKVIHGLAQSALAEEEDELVVLVKRGTVFPQKRLEQ